MKINVHEYNGAKGPRKLKKVSGTVCFTDLG